MEIPYFLLLFIVENLMVLKNKKLKSHPRVLSGDVFVICQENSWVDTATMMIYLKEIWLKPSNYKQTKETLLIMDSAHSHFSEDITNIFKKYNSNFLLIQPGLNLVLQSLDTHINKTFKLEMINQYNKWLFNNNSENIADENIIDFIYYR